MSQDFQPGDYLVFQVEAAFCLLRLLEIEKNPDETIWHLSAFEDMFLDVETADEALLTSEKLRISNPHMALTTRAFESTQTARMLNKPLNENDLAGLKKWKNDPRREISDTSVRLLLGLR